MLQKFGRKLKTQKQISKYLLADAGDFLCNSEKGHVSCGFFDLGRRG